MKKTLIIKMAKLLFHTATVCGMLGASTAFAGLPIANNGAGNISLTGAADPGADAFGGGSPLASTAPQFYSFDGGANFGLLSSYVYAPGVDPLNTLGGLTFVYTITNIYEFSPGFGKLEIGTQSSGTDWGTSVGLGYSTISAAAPTTGSLDLNSEVTFNWSPAAATQGWFDEVVCTAQQSYSLTPAYVGDGIGGNSANMNVLTPTAVPEPSTVTLLMLTLGIGACLRAFRKVQMAWAGANPLKVED